MTDRPVRVLVVDDHELLRTGLVTVLDSDPDLGVVGQVDSGPAAVRAAEEHRPDVVLMDVEMPGGDGITATRQIVGRLPCRVVVLTMFDLDDYVVEALRAGASGFLLKTAEPQALVAAVKACAAGDVSVSPGVMGRLVDSFDRARTPAPAVLGLDDLTARERDVLTSMARGRSNAEIARDLYLAETTVKTHVARILVKLQVRDRVQAVVAAHRGGIAPAP